MNVFAKIKNEIVSNNYITEDVVANWIEPNTSELHSFLLDEQLSATQVANLFSKISKLTIYSGNVPTIDQEWFVEHNTLWLVNPWSPKISNIVLSQQSSGEIIEKIGIFVSDYIADVKEDAEWSSAPDGVLDKVKNTSYASV